MAREQEQQQTAGNINRICQGTEITGNISTTSDIRIDGSLEGNINSNGKVVIGATGSTKGEIICRTADIFGTVDGSLNASEALSMKASASVKGTIITNKISIEVGAVFNGTCSMPEDKNTTQPKKS